ncbi:MAG: arylesterase [Deferrisomatales bacterium]
MVSIALTVAFVNAAGALGPSRPLRLLVLGDSLTAGYGLPAAASFPARLQAALQARGRAVVVENGGVSGDTSAGGRARVGWALGSGPDAVIVELGANDALRGLAPEALEENLDAIVAALTDRGVAVLLAGMRAPRNLGREYVARFEGAYRRVAARHGVALYPFFLEGVAGVARLNQADGLHPNEAGVEELVRRLLPEVEALLERAAGTRRP